MQYDEGVDGEFGSEFDDVEGVMGPSALAGRSTVCSAPSRRQEITTPG